MQYILVSDVIGQPVWGLKESLADRLKIGPLFNNKSIKADYWDKGSGRCLS